MSDKVFTDQISARAKRLARRYFPNALAVSAEAAFDIRCQSHRLAVAVIFRNGSGIFSQQHVTEREVILARDETVVAAIARSVLAQVHQELKQEAARRAAS